MSGKNNKAAMYWGFITAVVALFFIVLAAAGVRAGHVDSDSDLDVVNNPLLGFLQGQADMKEDEESKEKKEQGQSNLIYGPDGLNEDFEKDAS